MKKIIFTSIIMFFFVTNIFSQMEKGDKSIGFSFFLHSTEGTTFGNFNSTYGQNVSKHIRLTVGPGFTVQSMPGTGTYNMSTGTYTPGENEITITFSLSVDALYYFSTKARFSPFVGLGLYGTKNFNMFDFPIGITYFMSKNASWNTALRMGVGVSSFDTGTVSSTSSSFSLVLTTGLEFKF